MAKTSPTVKAYVAAFSSLRHQVSDKQRRLLSALYNAPHRTATAGELAKAAGYKSWSGANSAFGHLSRQLCNKLKMRKPKSGVWVSVLVSSVEQSPDEHMPLVLRPKIAAALKKLGWVVDRRTTVWRMAMRFGYRGREMWPECRKKGVAAIAYGPFAGIDLNKYEKGKPASRWAKLARTQRGFLQKVAYEMNKGDVIYVKEGSSIVGRGVVTGPYRFDPDCDIVHPEHPDVPFAHQVPVKWQKDFHPLSILLGSEPSTVLRLDGKRLRDLERAVDRTKTKSNKDGNSEARNSATEQTQRAHLVVSRSTHHDELRDCVKNGRFRWTATSHFAERDLAFFYIGEPYKRITAVGLVASAPETEEGVFSWTDRERVAYCEYSPVWWLPNPLLLKEACRVKVIRQWYAEKPFRNTRTVPSKVASAILQLIFRSNPISAEMIGAKLDKSSVRFSSTCGVATNTKYHEGDVTAIVSELVSRDRRLRADAIRVKGCKCKVCKFDFETTYGDIGVGFIEVHHLRPLSKAKGKQHTSLKEVEVVCPNCHRMLHTARPEPLSIAALKKIVESRRRLMNVSP